MRILLMVGVDDLARGNSRDDIVEAFMHFKLTVDKQNSFHPEKRNELVIPTILNPPQLTWFDDNGIAPPNHQNMLADLKELNSWIIYYNRQNGKEITPRFHRFGVQDGWGKDDRGRRVKVKNTCLLIGSKIVFTCMTKFAWNSALPSQGTFWESNQDRSTNLKGLFAQILHWFWFR